MTKKDTPECIVCGSKNVTIQEKATSVISPYGPELKIKEVYQDCGDCGSSIDVTSDSSVKKAIKKSNKESVKVILQYFTDNGYSLADIERSLDLPQRTISRWKQSGDLSAIGLALLRIVRTYPWILEVAELKYSEFSSKKIMIQNAIEQFMEYASSKKNMFFQSAGWSMHPTEEEDATDHLFHLTLRQDSLSPNEITSDDSVNVVPEGV